MKKFLSLVLALIMTMSLVTVSAGAKDFTDDEKITYDEAVAVMSEVKVLDGYTDGSFKPQGELTRGAAAKIICNLILGPTTAAELHADTAPYKDVPVDHTFAGYIAYCAKEGIISGYADGTFRPSAPLTGYAFMKMLLGALGYDQSVEGFTGANWSINVAKRALGIGLNKGLQTEFSGIKSVTREEAALYAFNTLQATMVDYEAKTTVSVGGADVVIAGSTAKEVEWLGYNNADGNIKNDNLIQFAEKYFPKLNKARDIDDFGRPTNVWTFNKEDIGAFVAVDLKVAEYTESFEYGELYNDIGANAAKSYDLYSYVDGDKGSVVKAEITKKNEDDVPDSDLGAKTEVFVDIENEEVYVTTINTWLGKAITDYNEKTGKATIEVYTGRTNAGATDSVSKRLSDEDFEAVKDLSEDDFVTVQMAKGVVKVLGEPEIVEDVTVSEYSSKPSDGQAHKDDKGRLKKVIVAGETYKIAAQAWYDAEYLYDYAEKQLDGFTYNLLLDQYGNLLGIKNVTSDEDTFFVVGYEKGSSYLAETVDKALVIFPDGTMKTVNAMEKKNAAEIPNGDGDYRVNAWYDYTINSDGVYVISGLTKRQIADVYTTGGKINKEFTTIAATGAIANTDSLTYIYGNADSVYISVDADTSVTGANNGGSIVKVNGVSTGIKNTSIEVKAGLQYDSAAHIGATGYYNVFALYNKSGYVTHAVVIGEDSSIADKLVYLTSGITSKYYDSDIKDYVYKYDAIINGEKTEVQSLTAFEPNGTTNLVKDTLYKASYDADGFVTDMVKNEAQAMNNTAAYKTHGYSVNSVASGATAATLTLKGATLYLTAGNNTNYVILDEDCKFYVNGKDDTNGKYDEYANASAMLAALGTDNAIDGAGKIVVIADKDSGFATSIIILDAVYTATGDAPVAPTAEYKVGFWQDSASGNVCFGFYKNDDSNTKLTQRELMDLGLKAEDFTIVINGNSYTGKTLTNVSNIIGGGMAALKINFGDPNTVLVKGDQYQIGSDGVEPDTNTIEFSFSIAGMNFDIESGSIVVTNFYTPAG